MPSEAKRKLLKVATRLRPHHNAVLILCYHGVSKTDEHVWNPRLYIQPEVFRRRMETIREFGYQVLPLSVAVEKMRERTLVAPTLVITFDDGWHDFYQVAWPILREYGFPATVYQTTYYTAYNRPIFDPACSYLLWRGAGRQISYLELDGSRAQLDLRPGGAVESARLDLLARAEERRLSGEDKDRLLQRLAEGVGVSYSQLLEGRRLHLMNEAEVREIACAGIDVQLHTHRHRLPAEKQAFLRELSENRGRLERLTGQPANDFCYPNGEYRPDIVEWLRGAGIRSATTCVPGRATDKSDRLLLPRVTDANSVSQVRFESWLAGVGLIAPRVKRTWRRWFEPARPSERQAESMAAVSNEAMNPTSASAKAVESEA